MSRKRDAIKFNGVSIRKSFITSFKSPEEFIEAMSGEGYAHIFAGDTREQQLRDLYEKEQPKAEPVAENATTAPALNAAETSQADTNTGKAFSPAVTGGKGAKAK